MDMAFNFEPLYPRHDLMVEISQVAMAIDSLGDRAIEERSMLQPGLMSRMDSLLDALDLLSV